MLEVRDAITQAPALAGAAVVLTDGEYRESISKGLDGKPALPSPGTLGPRALDDLTFAGAFERRGDYLMTVSKAGYRTWTGAVTVPQTPDGCHVVTQTIQVSLEPL